MTDDDTRRRQHAFILAAIRNYVEPSGIGTGTLNYAEPVGIHVDEAEDIPDFLDKIIAALDET